eukprot:1421696-Pleurochrysis_carterae.AAC.3
MRVGAQHGRWQAAVFLWHSHPVLARSKNLWCAGSKRAADQVEQGGDATTATQSVFAASTATRSATSSRARQCPMPPRS